jgi:hypothetical protein
MASAHSWVELRETPLVKGALQKLIELVDSRDSIKDLKKGIVHY